MGSVSAEISTKGTIFRKFLTRSCGMHVFFACNCSRDIKFRYSFCPDVEVFQRRLVRNNFIMKMKKNLFVGSIWTLLGLTGLFPTARLDLYGVGCKELADSGCLYVQFTSDVGGSLIILHSVMNNYCQRSEWHNNVLIVKETLGTSALASQNMAPGHAPSTSSHNLPLSESPGEVTFNQNHISHQ